MKKKLNIIVAVLVISVVALIGTQRLQQKYVYTSSNIGNTVEEKKNITEEENKIKEDNKEETTITEKALQTDKDDKVIKEETPKEEVKEAAANNTSDKSEQKPSQKEQKSSKSEEKNESGNTNIATTSSQNVQVEKKEEPNIFIMDEVNGKQILSCYLDIEGKNAANITIEALASKGISYKVDSSMYFSSIAGLKERSAGKASGWCYYVNGVKPGVGAGSYVLKKGDKLTWKFLKDGINN